jgi:hypothetical protein
MSWTECYISCVFEAQGLRGVHFVMFQELKKHKVKDVFRVCEPSYKIEELKNEGINVTDLEFDDGTPPPLRVRNIYIMVEVPTESSV